MRKATRLSGTASADPGYSRLWRSRTDRHEDVKARNRLVPNNCRLRQIVIDSLLSEVDALHDMKKEGEIIIQIKDEGQVPAASR